MNEAFKDKIAAILPGATTDDSGEIPFLQISGGDLLTLMQPLRSDPAFSFDYLFSLTCVDWKDRLVVVYHLMSRKTRQRLVVKAELRDVENPEIESVYHLWKTAELLEDEVYDLFGVKFLNHPNLRRLFLDDHWKGNPLRKNYTDPNMIKL
jgi:NADH-quinone oxidoreductase subunit C